MGGAGWRWGEGLRVDVISTRGEKRVRYRLGEGHTRIYPYDYFPIQRALFKLYDGGVKKVASARNEIPPAVADFLKIAPKPLSAVAVVTMCLLY